MADPFPHPLASELRSNPFDCYRWLRAERPIYYTPEENYWALSRYADVQAAARNHADFSSAQGIGRSSLLGQTMLTSDPPHHTRLRTLVTRAFQPGVIEALAPRVEAICEQLIDSSAVSRGEFDLMEDFAHPLPIWVIAELLGFDPARLSDFRRWADAASEYLTFPDSTETQRKYAATNAQFIRYLYEIGSARVRNPGSDLLSSFIRARVERDALTPDEIRFACELFLAAGGETTAGLIGNAALALTANPDQAARVLKEPDLIPSMVEESVRYDGPFRAVFRTTTRDLTLHDVQIPRGARVALLLASANRDEEVFPEPDRFLVTRTPNPHLGFGTGIHYCIGAPLARLEARVAATVLMRRFQHLEPRRSGPPEWSAVTPLLQKLSRLPMDFELRRG